MYRLNWTMKYESTAEMTESTVLLLNHPSSPASWVSNRLTFKRDILDIEETASGFHQPLRHMRHVTFASVKRMPRARDPT
jgi:hypothetical protein